ncbi:MAG: ribulose-phosphate 3-epimerase [Sphingobacteriales bacterium]|nr:MAG: ribulose-phosphate 3-epimerase [Sphingobacteriales bacterium]TAF82426.1 MAG: ribulose-phosphate 3-epimerase [Sphingobacteriales bacterium]
MNQLISPSVLAANFANLNDDILMLNQSEADWVHIDVMDGVFVPNISFGFPVLSAVKKIATKPLDVHLMIIEPDKYLAEFAANGAYMLTVHYEACPHLHCTVQKIKALGCKAGVALNPHTPISVLDDIVEEVDMVLIMSVNPGFGGQTFIPNTYKKIQQLRAIANQRNPNLHIEIDGGVNVANALALLQAGADVLVAGNAIFSHAQPKSIISTLKNLNPNTQSA